MMVVQRLFIRLTLFYAAISALVFGVVTIQPCVADFWPIGGAQSLLTGPASDPFESIEIGANRVADLGGSILWLLIAVAGALLTTLPVTWTYMASRNLKEYDLHRHFGRLPNNDRAKIQESDVVKEDPSR